MKTKIKAVTSRRGWVATLVILSLVTCPLSLSFAQGGNVNITRGPKGAANYANGQVAATTTAATLVASRATRRSVTIRNTDAAISVYIGKATVTSGNGMLLKAGEQVNLDTTALIQVISASGTPSVAYFETYD